MAHGHHVSAADENVGFAEADALVDDLGGAGDDEQRLAVLLELGAGGACRRPRWRADADRTAPAPAPAARGLGSYKPIQTMARPPRPFAGVLDRDGGDALAAGVDARGNHARSLRGPPNVVEAVLSSMAGSRAPACSRTIRFRWPSGCCWPIHARCHKSIVKGGVPHAASDQRTLALRRVDCRLCRVRRRVRRFRASAVGRRRRAGTGAQLGLSAPEHNNGRARPHRPRPAGARRSRWAAPRWRGSSASPMARAGSCSAT